MTTAPALHVISSMATRLVLNELADAYARASGREVRVESVGGVDAAKRVRGGEPFDAVVLASDAIDGLIADGAVVAGSRVDIVRSGVAVAVREGSVRPDIGSEDALRRAVLASLSIGYSTGPSGTALKKLFERWGIAQQVESRLVQASAGVPVGSLVADGRVELGFQQLSELMHLPGITVLGTLPPPIEIVTTFSGGVATRSAQPDAAGALLAHLAAPASATAKVRHGMQPAD